MVPISIIIIGRNEEDNIEKCLRSVIKGTEDFSKKEIVYVDSASTDNTIEIVKRFPIKILKLKSDWDLSPSAGRYIGYLNTSEKYLFFVDGDSIVYSKWLKDAVSYLENHEEIGGIAGILHEMFIEKDGEKIGFSKNKYHQKEPYEEVRLLGGSALYKRHVLDEVGPFNPYLTTEEERELGLRIRRAGYKLIRNQKQMGIKQTPPRDSFQEIFRRFNTNLYSYGPTIRYCIHNGLFWQYFRERLGFLVVFALGVLVSCILFIVAVMAKSRLLLFSIGIVILIILISMKKLDMKSILKAVINRSAILLKTIQTFITAKVVLPDNYPTDVIIIKEPKLNA